MPVFSRIQNPHLWLISSGFKFAQALALTKIPDFGKPYKTIYKESVKTVLEKIKKK